MEDEPTTIDDLLRMCPAEVREAVSKPKDPFCVSCGINPPRMSWADHCAECAAASCVLMTDDAWRTFAEGQFAVARRNKREAESCPHCEGTSWITFRDFDRKCHGVPYTFTKPCPGQALDARLELFNAAKVPGNLHGAGFRNFDAYTKPLKAVLDRVCEWSTKVEPTPAFGGLRLVGDNGTGKTHLLAAICKHLTIVRGFSVRYLDWSDLIRKLQSAAARGSDAESVLQPFARVPFLLLDEIGKGEAREWRLDALETLIEWRYRDASSITCVVSNLHGDELKGKIGNRVASRLNEMTSTVVVYGRDFREGRGFSTER